MLRCGFPVVLRPRHFFPSSFSSLPFHFPPLSFVVPLRVASPPLFKFTSWSEFSNISKPSIRLMIEVYIFILFLYFFSKLQLNFFFFCKIQNASLSRFQHCNFLKLIFFFEVLPRTTTGIQFKINYYKKKKVVFLNTTKKKLQIFSLATLKPPFCVHFETRDASNPTINFGFYVVLVTAMTKEIRGMKFRDVRSA